MTFRLRRPAKLLSLVMALALCALAYVFALKPYLMRQRYVVRYPDIVGAQAEAYGIDPYLLLSMIYCESTFNPNALSRVGARGLMQIMPDTGGWLAGKLAIDGYDPAILFDPDTNIAMGCWYMRFLLDRYGGDTTSAVAAFHCGQGTVDRWLDDPALSYDGKTLSDIPEGETSKYVNRVLSAYEIYKQLYPSGY